MSVGKTQKASQQVCGCCVVLPGAIQASLAASVSCCCGLIVVTAVSKGSKQGLVVLGTVGAVLWGVCQEEGPTMDQKWQCSHYKDPQEKDSLSIETATWEP